MAENSGFTNKEALAQATGQNPDAEPMQEPSAEAYAKAKKKVRKMVEHTWDEDSPWHAALGNQGLSENVMGQVKNITYDEKDQTLNLYTKNQRGVKSTGCRIKIDQNGDMTMDKTSYTRRAVSTAINTPFNTTAKLTGWIPVVGIVTAGLALVATVATDKLIMDRGKEFASKGDALQFAEIATEAGKSTLNIGEDVDQKQRKNLIIAAAVHDITARDSETGQEIDIKAFMLENKGIAKTIEKERAKLGKEPYKPKTPATEPAATAPEAPKQSGFSAQPQPAPDTAPQNSKPATPETTDPQDSLFDALCELAEELESEFPAPDDRSLKENLSLQAVYDMQDMVVNGDKGLNSDQRMEIGEIEAIGKALDNKEFDLARKTMSAAMGGPDPTPAKPSVAPTQATPVQKAERSGFTAPQPSQGR